MEQQIKVTSHEFNGWLMSFTDAIVDDTFAVRSVVAYPPEERFEGEMLHPLLFKITIKRKEVEEGVVQYEMIPAFSNSHSAYHQWYSLSPELINELSDENGFNHLGFGAGHTLWDAEEEEEEVPEEFMGFIDTLSDLDEL